MGSSCLSELSSTARRRLSAVGSGGWAPRRRPARGRRSDGRGRPRTAPAGRPRAGESCPGVAKDAEHIPAVGRRRADVGDERAPARAAHQDARGLAPLREWGRLPEAGPGSGAHRAARRQGQRQRERCASQRNQSKPRRQAPGAYFAAEPITAGAKAGRVRTKAPRAPADAVTPHRPIGQTLALKARRGYDCNWKRTMALRLRQRTFDRGM
jgi:hypothetical protein